MSTPIRVLVQFVVIMLVQVLFLNSVEIKSSLSLFNVPVFIPMLYPLIILLMPVNTKPLVLMLIGFFTGLIMDMFCMTPGMHASATLLIAFIRPFILGLLMQQQTKDLGSTVPSLYKLGFNSFVVYAAIMIFTHHFYFYILHIWSLKNILIILYKTLLSGVLSIILVILAELLFARKEIKRA